ncbi:MAG TPA: hypothetical protein VM425_09520 [Myxococcota bacterium]|nr:hypothetical protein [Myxococcota bacterium]
MKHLSVIAVILLAAGCGYLSNEPYWTGEGLVHGNVLAAGQPLEGAQVFVIGEAERMTTTGADGSFEMVASAGTGKTLAVIWGASLGLQHEFNLAGEGDLDLGDIEPETIGSLGGVVALDVPGRVEVSVSGTPIVTHPDESGSFHVALPAGKWDLVLQATGFIDQSIENLRVRSGESKQVETISMPVDPDHVCLGSESRSERFSQGGGGAVDALFIVDNSGSMVGEQQALAHSFNAFTAALNEAVVDYHIAVVTTGMESPGCPVCAGVVSSSCMNETGENGRFQDRLGHNQGTIDSPDFIFTSDPTCREVTDANLDCFYDQALDRGTVLVGVNGCGYERGLASMRKALGELSASYNAGFLREWARLAVVVVSDEDDCGEVGDVTEGLPAIGGNACYFAAKGADGEGATVDPEGKPYALTPVDEYASFLQGLKPVASLVSFSAMVGVRDLADPLSTSIEYFWDDVRQTWDIVPACVTPGCIGSFCSSKPGTRYIKLAQKLSGTIETICQADFSQPMLKVIGASVGYQRKFHLSGDPISADTVKVSINGTALETGFVFEPAAREVVFDQGKAPAPYALVKIDYQAACP